MCDFFNRSSVIRFAGLCMLAIILTGCDAKKDDVLGTWETDDLCKSGCIAGPTYYKINFLSDGTCVFSIMGDGDGGDNEYVQQPACTWDILNDGRVNLKWGSRGGGAQTWLGTINPTNLSFDIGGDAPMIFGRSSS